MRLSTKSRFAVDAVIDLGLREQAGPVPLASIAGRQQISLSYLEQLFASLRRDGIVESTRGPGGGYTLGRAAEQVTLADIVTAVEDRSGAPKDAAALSQGLWESLDAVMLRHMQTITLRTLLEQQQASGVVVEPQPQARRSVGLRPVAKPVRPRVPNSVFAFGQSFARD